MEEKRETIDEIRESHEGILEFLGKLIPLGILFTAFIGFGIAYMSFIVNNGYTHQMNSVEKNGIEHFMDNFTDGNVAMMTKGPVVTIINGLAVLQIIVLLITYCKHDFKKNMVLSVVSFIAIGVVTVVSMVYWGAVKGYLVIPEKVQINLARVMAENTNLSIALVLGVILILTLFAVKILKTEYKRMLTYGVGALVIGRCLLPLLLLVLENGVSILAALAGVVALIAVLWVIGSMVGSGGADMKSYDYQNVDRERELRDKKENNKQENKEQFRGVLKLGYGVRAYKVKGWDHDYIVSDNGLCSSEFCSLYDFRKGLYKIEDANGKRLFEDDLEWRKR